MSPENEIAVEPPAAERVGRELSRWFGNSDFAARSREPAAVRESGKHIDWARVLPFLPCTQPVWP